MAQAAANVARWYELPSVAQKTLDWFTLLTVAGAVVRPRIVAVGLRVQVEKIQKRDAVIRQAAARQGAPVVQRDNMTAAPGPAPARPAPPAPKMNGSKPPPLQADPGMMLQDAERLSPDDLRFFTPGGEVN
ncbi:MAG: hypothetical protein P4M15_08665 [Alphaproteobacteria bacterium]|nr:hypothetical protein [Alphaproteobacteria bacterium]